MRWRQRRQGFDPTKIWIASGGAVPSEATLLRMGKPSAENAPTSDARTSPHSETRELSISAPNPLKPVAIAAGGLPGIVITSDPAFCLACRIQPDACSVAASCSVKDCGSGSGRTAKSKRIPENDLNFLMMRCLCSSPIRRGALIFSSASSASSARRRVCSCRARELSFSLEPRSFIR